MKGNLALPNRGYVGEFFPILVLLIIMVPIYFVLPSRMMSAEILIMAMPTLAFILLLGYAGLMNFSTGSLFAVGAYSAGILLARYQTHVLVAMLVGIGLSGIVAAGIGYLCIRAGGLVFGLITLAFNQLIWFIIYQWKDFTGGPDGIWGIKRSTLDLGFFTINLRPSFNFYIFVLLFFLLLLIFLRRFIESPFGTALVGMRESELRARAVGYHPETYKWIVFILSSMICGLGGVLFALHQEYVGEHLASWTASGEIMIMALVGGSFSLYGALIGAGVFILLTDILNKFTVLSRAGVWLLVLGVIFIIVVMFLKRGIYGGFEKIFESIVKKEGIQE